MFRELKETAKLILVALLCIQIVGIHRLGLAAENAPKAAASQNAATPSAPSAAPALDPQEKALLELLEHHQALAVESRSLLDKLTACAQFPNTRRARELGCDGEKNISQIRTDSISATATFLAWKKRLEDDFAGKGSVQLQPVHVFILSSFYFKALKDLLMVRFLAESRVANGSLNKQSYIELAAWAKEMGLNIPGSFLPEQSGLTFIDGFTTNRAALALLNSPGSFVEIDPRSFIGLNTEAGTTSTFRLQLTDQAIAGAHISGATTRPDAQSLLILIKATVTQMLYQKATEIRMSRKEAVPPPLPETPAKLIRDIPSMAVVRASSQSLLNVSREPELRSALITAYKELTQNPANFEAKLVTQEWTSLLSKFISEKRIPLKSPDAISFELLQKAELTQTSAEVARLVNNWNLDFTAMTDDIFIGSLKALIAHARLEALRSTLDAAMKSPSSAQIAELRSHLLQLAAKHAESIPNTQAFLWLDQARVKFIKQNRLNYHRSLALGLVQSAVELEKQTSLPDDQLLTVPKLLWTLHQYTIMSLGLNPIAMNYLQPIASSEDYAASLMAYRSATAETKTLLEQRTGESKVTLERTLQNLTVVGRLLGFEGRKDIYAQPTLAEVLPGKDSERQRKLYRKLMLWDHPFHRIFGLKLDLTGFKVEKWFRSTLYEQLVPIGKSSTDENARYAAAGPLLDAAMDKQDDLIKKDLAILADAKSFSDLEFTSEFNAIKEMVDQQFPSLDGSFKQLSREASYPAEWREKFSAINLAYSAPFLPYLAFLLLQGGSWLAGFIPHPGVKVAAKTAGLFFKYQNARMMAYAPAYFITAGLAGLFLLGVQYGNYDEISDNLKSLEDFYFTGITSEPFLDYVSIDAYSDRGKFEAANLLFGVALTVILLKPVFFKNLASSLMAKLEVGSIHWAQNTIRKAPAVAEAGSTRTKRLRIATRIRDAHLRMHQKRSDRIWDRASSQCGKLGLTRAQCFNELKLDDAFEVATTRHQQGQLSSKQFDEIMSARNFIKDQMKQGRIEAMVSSLWNRSGEKAVERLISLEPEYVTSIQRDIYRVSRLSDRVRPAPFNVKRDYYSWLGIRAMDPARSGKISELSDEFIKNAYEARIKYLENLIARGNPSAKRSAEDQMLKAREAFRVFSDKNSKAFFNHARLNIYEKAAASSSTTSSPKGPPSSKKPVENRNLGPSADAPPYKYVPITDEQLIADKDIHKDVNLYSILFKGENSIFDPAQTSGQAPYTDKQINDAFVRLEISILETIRGRPFVHSNWEQLTLELQTELALARKAREVLKTASQRQLYNQTRRSVAGKPPLTSQAPPSERPLVESPAYKFVPLKEEQRIAKLDLHKDYNLYKVLFKGEDAVFDPATNPGLAPYSDKQINDAFVRLERTILETVRTRPFEHKNWDQLTEDLLDELAIARKAKDLLRSAQLRKQYDQSRRAALKGGASAPTAEAS